MLYYCGKAVASFLCRLHLTKFELNVNCANLISLACDPLSTFQSSPPGPSGVLSAILSRRPDLKKKIKQ